jgi:hypothetical protein
MTTSERSAEQVQAYEDALRNIAAAVVAAGRQRYDLVTLQSMLADIEHQLSSLIVLGFVPPESDRVIVTSMLGAFRDARQALE